VFAYRFLAPVLIAAALLYRGPYLFSHDSAADETPGMLKYRALARAPVGEQFEQKWLNRDDSLKGRRSDDIGFLLHS